MSIWAVVMHTRRRETRTLSSLQDDATDRGLDRGRVWRQESLLQPYLPDRRCGSNEESVRGSNGDRWCSRAGLASGGAPPAAAGDSDGSGDRGRSWGRLNGARGHGLGVVGRSMERRHTDAQPLGTWRRRASREGLGDPVQPQNKLFTQITHRSTERREDDIGE